MDRLEWGTPERFGAGKGVGWMVSLKGTTSQICLYDPGELLVCEDADDGAYQACIDVADCRPALAALLQAAGYSVAAPPAQGAE